MNEIFKKTFTLTNNLYDRTDTLKPSSIFDLSQEISGDHADILHCGFTEFIAKGYIWVIVRNYVEFIKPIKHVSSLDLETYLTKPRFVEYPREVCFYSKEGLVAITKSIWMILDYKTFNVVTPELFNDIDYSKIHPYFTTRLKKLSLIPKEKLEFCKDIIVTYSMLDHNGHLNNTHYLDFYLDVYQPSKYIKSLQVEYIKQGFLNDKISLYRYSENEKDYLYGYRNEDLIFYMKVEYFRGEQNEN